MLAYKTPSSNSSSQAISDATVRFELADVLVLNHKNLEVGAGKLAFSLAFNIANT
jgi:hypothetical protein